MAEHRDAVVERARDRRELPGVYHEAFASFAKPVHQVSSTAQLAVQYAELARATGGERGRSGSDTTLTPL